MPATSRPAVPRPQHERRAGHSFTATLIAFDVLAHQGRDRCHHSWATRAAAVFDQLLDGAHGAVWATPFFDAADQAAHEILIADGWEGKAPSPNAPTPATAAGTAATPGSSSRAAPHANATAARCAAAWRHTQYHGAATVANPLPNSALLPVQGWGHTSLFFPACADETITRYLVDLTTPPPGTVCRQDVVPFGP